jgi:hypothetical protein
MIANALPAGPLNRLRDEIVFTPRQRPFLENGNAILIQPGGLAVDRMSANLDIII